MLKKSIDLHDLQNFSTEDGVLLIVVVFQNLQGCACPESAHGCGVTLRMHALPPNRVYSSIIKDCYYPDSSQNRGKFVFELRKAEAQALCRAFDKAAGANPGYRARVQAAVRAPAPAPPAASAAAAAAAPPQPQQSAARQQPQQQQQDSSRPARAAERAPSLQQGQPAAVAAVKVAKPTAGQPPSSSAPQALPAPQQRRPAPAATVPAKAAAKAMEQPSSSESSTVPAARQPVLKEVLLLLAPLLAATLTPCS